MEKADHYRYVPEYRDIDKERKEAIERAFANAKKNHGMHLYKNAWIAKGKDAGHAYFCVHEFEKTGNVEA